jgi:CelD/BcsL family acetyltransferase involved in cellulose biosynthesis
MGPGDNPYKKRWTEEAEPLFRLDAYSPAVRGRIAALWDNQIKPRLRALKAIMKRQKEAETQ